MNSLTRGKIFSCGHATLKEALSVCRFVMVIELKIAKMRIFEAQAVTVCVGWARV